MSAKGHANNASLNLQRELLHQDRLAFTLERIAFDNQSKAASATAKATEANKTGQKVSFLPWYKRSFKKTVLNLTKHVSMNINFSISKIKTFKPFIFTGHCRSGALAQIW